MVMDWASAGMVIWGCKRIAAGGHHIAILVELELAVAGIRQLSVGLQHLKEAPPLDDHVQRVVGLRETALRGDDLVARRARAQPQLQPGRNHGLLAGGSARLQQVLVEQILKLHPPRLVSGGVGVGQVVGDVVHVHLLRRHTAGGAEKRSHHNELLSCSPRALGSHAGNFFDRLAIHLRSQRGGLLQHFKLAHDRHQPYGRFRGAHIGTLQLALLDLRAGRRLGLAPRSENSWPLA